MVGTHKNGNPRKEKYLYDIFTRHFEMKFTDAKPVDMPEMIDYYNQYHPTFLTFYDAKERRKNRKLKKKLRIDSAGSSPSDIDSYDIVKFFIQHQVSQKENSHFILDEVPIFQQKSNYIILHKVK